jgi:hypothetical protein
MNLAIGAEADWPFETTVLATGDTALGRGARAPLPLHLIYESEDLRLAPNQNAHWRVIIEVQPTPQLSVPVIVRPKPD